VSVVLGLDIFGDKQLDREILRVERNGQDMSPAFRAIADVFLAANKAQFDTQGSAGSGGWKPLAESTKTYKLAAGLDPRIMHATLALRRSLTTPGDPNQIRRISSDEMVLGTAVKSAKGFPYPAVHQHGSRDGRIPRRRPVELTANQRNRWVKILQRFLFTGEVMAGGTK
jgi:phage gpG-like protein